MKFCIHNHTMVIKIKYKFHEIPKVANKVMAEDEKNTLKFRQLKGNNSSITDDTLMKLHVHNHTMVIYIQFTFHEIPFIINIVMADDGKNHWHIGNQRVITPL